MNDYTRTLHREIAAQLGGAIPSKIWGRIVDAHKDKSARKYFQLVHHTGDPGAKNISGEYPDMIRGIAKSFRNGLNASSIVKKDSIKH